MLKNRELAVARRRRCHPPLGAKLAARRRRQRSTAAEMRGGPTADILGRGEGHSSAPSSSSPPAAQPGAGAVEPTPESAQVEAPPPPQPPTRLHPSLVTEAQPLAKGAARGAAKRGAAVSRGAPRETRPHEAARTGESQSSGGRWWTRLDPTLLCPLTRFPVAFLPYPPFKMRVDAHKAEPHRLIDGKVLALTIIVTGNAQCMGRGLTALEVQSLDDYVRRCRLGAFRPSHALELWLEARLAETAEARAHTADELHAVARPARVELEKVRRIQEQRMRRCVDQFSGAASSSLSSVHSSGPLRQGSGHARDAG